MKKLLCVFLMLGMMSSGIAFAGDLPKDNPIKYLRSDDIVNREEFMAMLCRMISDMGYISERGEYDMSKYADLSEVSDYAKKSYKA